MTTERRPTVGIHVDGAVHARRVPPSVAILLGLIVIACAILWVILDESANGAVRVIVRGVLRGLR